MSHSAWATAALQFPTMAVCVIDTTGINSEADIIRVYVATTSGTIYDQLFYSERHRTSNERFTGLPEDTLLEMPTLPEEWEHLKAALTSHYLLAYNLDFIQERLNENALYYQLEPFTLIGDDVQQTAVEYFRSGYNLSLKDACKQIGHTMPHDPPMAQDRAAAQFALLRAMAGTPDETTDSEMDDHPF